VPTAARAKRTVVRSRCALHANLSIIAAETAKLLIINNTKKLAKSKPTIWLCFKILLEKTVPSACYLFHFAKARHRSDTAVVKLFV
jgi:hypothetical protein